MNQESKTELEQAVTSALKDIHVYSYEAEQRLAKLAVGKNNLPSLAKDYLKDSEAPITGDPSIAIGAYILAHTYNRRQGNRRDCERLDERMSDLLNGKGQYPIVDHFRAMTKVMGSHQDVVESIDLSRRAAENFPDHPGILHSLAAAYLRLSEFERLEDGDLLIAENAVSNAIRRENQKARFYYSRARVLKLRGKYQQALDSLSTAVNLEDSSSEDYQLRLAEYKIENASIVIESRINDQMANMKSEVKRMSSDLSGAQRSLEAAQLRQVETLAVFTAVLGLINIGAKIAISYPFWQAGLLIAVVGIVFIGAAYVAHVMVDSRLKRRTNS